MLSSALEHIEDFSAGRKIDYVIVGRHVCTDLLIGLLSLSSLFMLLIEAFICARVDQLLRSKVHFELSAKSPPQSKRPWHW